ncbi:fatty acid desaturase family protein [Spongiactinospora gelatinilytica]|uniref:fatty acid desaturase family protein n=1 Tax=Spongiactinospora gelatinilytica TaxID=2666298 RepID=UPI003F67E1A6
MTGSTMVDPPDRSVSGRGSDFARLSRRIAEAGLLDRRPGYYVVRFGIVGFLYAAGWAAVFLIGESWPLAIGLAVLLAVIFAQTALVAHDLAHKQVFRTRRATEVTGLIVGNLLIGMGYGWWNDKHNRHHANPNHEDLDPDVSPDVLIWSKEQAEASGGLARFIGRRQAFLFFPLLTLEGLNLHVSSFRALFRPFMKRRGIEAALLIGHVVLGVGAVLLALPLPQALVFLVVHQAVFGVYLGCTFAPNHKGMPTLRGEERLDFLRRQVLTSRNVTGGRFVDIALGGLNYQIEHHLFPGMPSPNLRRAQPIVRDYCAELGIDYQECGLIRSYAKALRHMHEVGEPIRAAGRVKSSA